MKRKITGLVLALVMVITIFAVVPLGVSAANTWTVDDDGPANFSTIQEGIDAASSGDTVQVAAGTYNENITLKSGVTVQGAGAADTTIDGGGSGSVVTANNVDSTAKLDGFTITNGSASYGGGIYLYNSSPTVTNCTFSGNSATLYGGGMSNYSNSSPTVTNCTFSGNSANYQGSGMFNYSNSSPTVTNCIFSGNSPTFYGGGMSNYSNSSPTVTNCIFSGNSANKGGGMFNYSNSSPTVTNCTFSGNSPTIYGGGMYNIWDSSPTVTNCIISTNTAIVQGGGIYASASAPIIDYNDVWNNAGGDYVGCWPGSNDISQDPLFVDPGADDYHLQSGSPCIDAGSDAAVPSWLTTDFEGDPRIWPEGGVVDMGADEFVSVNEPPVADAGPDQTAEANTVGGANVTLDGSGSYDPDGDPLTYTWTWVGGSPSGVSPTVLLPLGTTTVTLVVNDGTVDSDPDTVDIIVQDTTPPEVTANLVPIKVKENEGTCTVECGATDICDADPTVTAVIEVPFVTDVDYEYKYKNGVLKVDGPSITLSVTAVDASGNVDTAVATLEFTREPEDED